MTSNKDHSSAPKKGATEKNKGQSSDWTNGLRQLYDSVVDEPIPDSFKDLLAQLDDDGDDDHSKDASSDARGHN